MPLKVQFPLPTIGLQLYQLGVHIRANKKILVLCYKYFKTGELQDKEFDRNRRTPIDRIGD